MKCPTCNNEGMYVSHRDDLKIHYACNISGCSGQLTVDTDYKQGADWLKITLGAVGAIVGTIASVIVIVNGGRRPSL